MALDGIILGKVAKQLQDALPIRINRIADVSKTELVFNVHANSLRSNLVISLHSLYNHIAFSNRNYATYNDASTFTMVLRKHLLNGIVYQIDQNEYDRYLILHIRSLNELYDEKEYLLSIELMGKYANLILIDKTSGRIIDALKKIPPFENTRRTILQGAAFELPASQHKADPFNSEPDFDDSLVKQLQGFSKLLENEVRYRLNTQSFKEIMQEIANSDHLYISENGDYHLIPLTHLNLPYQVYELNTGFDELYYHNDEKERIKNITDDIYKFIKRQLKHYQAKIAKLSESLDEAKAPNIDKEYGDLLYTYSDIEQKGLSTIDITDFEGELKTIALDPKLSIKQNANKYYNSYAKKRRSIAFIEEQLEKAQGEQEYFRALNDQLEIANYTDALDIKEELISYGYLEQKSRKNVKKKKIMLYQCQVEDKIITFGKNNLQNDYLTFSFAKPHYLYFHAKDYHGAHLVVNASEVNETVLRACANLAAYHSKGRYSGSVPVNYCLVKNVKKVKGAKRGFVTIHNYKTIFVDPFEDKELIIKKI